MSCNCISNGKYKRVDEMFFYLDEHELDNFNVTVNMDRRLHSKALTIEDANFTTYYEKNKDGKIIFLSAGSGTYFTLTPKSKKEKAITKIKDQPFFR